MGSSPEIVKTRFAPSPTGFITLGNYRTALFNYLFSLKNGGEMLLRYEDTDSERSNGAFVEQIEQDLEFMGVGFDRSKVVFQSKQEKFYDEIYQKLIDNDQVYECFCSCDDLALERKMQLAQGQPPKYSGRCRDLTYQQKNEFLEQGKKPVLRFKVEADRVIEFNDLIMGPKQFDSNTIGDFIIRKANLDAAFFFANAVDDVQSGITHVFRGDDHVTNTPRQIMLMQALGWTVPKYGHYPLILGSDHKPLSKRTGSRSIAELNETGILPQAINNFLSRLGHSISNNTLLPLAELAEEFSLDKLSNSSSHFDPCQLDFWQRKAFSELSENQYTALIENNCPLVEQKDIQQFWDIAHANCQTASDLEHWSHYLLDASIDIDTERLSQFQWSAEILLSVRLTWPDGWSAVVSSLKKNFGLKGKSLFMPLRLILSGQEDGPPLDDLYNFVPHDIINQRIGKIIDDYKTV